jgi:hypothetical protein
MRASLGVADVLANLRGAAIAFRMRISFSNAGSMGIGADEDRGAGRLANRADASAGHAELEETTRKLSYLAASLA